MQGTAAGNGQPAAQSKLRELRQRARATCFVPVMAINKLDFMAGISFFHMSARFRADFLATNKNSQDWEQPVMQKIKTTGILGWSGILRWAVKKDQLKK